jgi:uncharacterized protein (DUF1330 family)
MRTDKMLCVFIVLFLAVPLGTAQAAPPLITGTPVIDRPQLLNWPEDLPVVQPDITEPTTNLLSDLHANVAECDIALSSPGNFHMALSAMWHQVYLPSVTVLGIKNWFFTTSPPISADQIANEHVGVGNFRSSCRPQVAIGNKAVMDDLAVRGYTDGAPVAIIRNRGNVLLVKNGNPKMITGIWDLERADVRVAFPNQETEPSSFSNYSNSLYNMAVNERGTAAADALYNSVFNNTAVYGKWLNGYRIHHREVPWSVSIGHADVALLFYHTARHAARTFPRRFDIIPLGGTPDNPQPVAGNAVVTLYAVRITGAWTQKQYDARERLMSALTSSAFTTILQQHGLERPPAQ